MSPSSCPVPASAEDHLGRGSAYLPMLYTSAASVSLTFIIVLVLTLSHLRQYRCPDQQRQVIRIAFAPFVIALVSFFEVYSYAVAQYIDAISDLYEAFCLCALLLLYIHSLSPDPVVSDASESTKSMLSPSSDLSYGDCPRITWLLVFQYPLTELVAIIILEATEATGTYCTQSLAPQYGHLWVEIISSIGVGLAVLSILRFYGRNKKQIRLQRALTKLVCFKLIVFSRFLQSLIFSNLLNHNDIRPSNTFSYDDLLYGLENTITCAEMAVLACVFWYAYDPREYNSQNKPNDPPLSIYHAILDSLNPSDIILGIHRWFALVLSPTHTQGSTQGLESRRFRPVTWLLLRGRGRR